MKLSIKLLLISAILLSSCEPSYVADGDPDYNMDSSVLDLEVVNTTPGGNQIRMVNRSKGVAATCWDYASGISYKNEEVVVLPFKGKIPIKCKTLGSYGTITKTIEVEISNFDHEISPWWELLAGTTAEGKIWKWDTVTDEKGPVNNGKYPSESWGWYPTMDELGGKDWFLKFDINGNANFDMNGLKGSFSFDDTGKLENGAEVLGTLSLGGELLPKDNGASTNIYLVKKLTATHMELFLPGNGGGMFYRLVAQ